MATSSIFHNVIINDPKQADDFLNAIESSQADEYKFKNYKNSSVSLISDKNEIAGLQLMRRKLRVK